MVHTVQFYLYETLQGKLIYGERVQLSGGKGRTQWEGLTGKYYKENFEVMENRCILIGATDRQVCAFVRTYRSLSKSDA